MTTKHTPGPWTIAPPERERGKYKPDHPGYSWHRIVDSDGSTVGFTPSKQRADLFAEAPAMADVLRSMIEYHPDPGTGREYLRVNLVIARAILARIDGNPKEG